eukprot:Awhi_evm1s7949
MFLESSYHNLLFHKNNGKKNAKNHENGRDKIVDVSECNETNKDPNDKMESNSDSKIKQILVTASPLLCDAIRNSYNKMCYSASQSSTSAFASVQSSALDHDNINNCNSDTKNENKKNKNHDNNNNNHNNNNNNEVTNFIGPSAECFPLFITYENFLEMLDNSLRTSFEGNRITNNKRKGNSVGRRHDRNAKRLGLVPERDDRMVDYERFSLSFFPHFNDNLNASCALVYTEIMSFIKGSVMSLKTTTGYLSCEDYVKLADQRRNSVLDHES